MGRISGIAVTEMSFDEMTVSGPAETDPVEMYQPQKNIISEVIERYLTGTQVFEKQIQGSRRKVDGLFQKELGADEIFHKQFQQKVQMHC